MRKLRRRESRWTFKNAGKAIAAFMFSPFLPYYTLILGLTSEKKKVIAEGLLYAIAFTSALAAPAFFGEISAFLVAGSYLASGVRMFQLRDMWLPMSGGNPQRQILHPPPYSQIGSRRYPETPPQVTQRPPRQVESGSKGQTPPPYAGSSSSTAATPSPEPATSGLPDDLSGSLEWVSSTAKRNKQRIPSEAYISVLELSQELSALIDNEHKSPSGDAEFEYELESLAGQYLPAVLKGYLAIPPALIEQVQPNGKTPNVELVEQLELLSGQTEALYMSRYSHTTAELTTTGNFLRERYGHRKSDAFDFGVE